MKPGIWAMQWVNSYSISSVETLIFCNFLNFFVIILVEPAEDTSRINVYSFESLVISLWNHKNLIVNLGDLVIPEPYRVISSY